MQKWLVLLPPCVVTQDARLDQICKDLGLSSPYSGPRLLSFESDRPFHGSRKAFALHKCQTPWKDPRVFQEDFETAE